MENPTVGFAKTAQALADKAAAKTQSSLQSARHTAKNTDRLPSSKLEDMRDEAGTVISRGSMRVRSGSKQGFDAITETAGQARDVASNAIEAIVTYTKENPVKALGIAAIAGALLYAAIKAARD